MRFKRGTVPYFKWRADKAGKGRPRWEPGPALRDAGFKGRDLKDDAGAWLGLEAAIAAATRLNLEVEAWRGSGAKRAPRLRPPPAGKSVGVLWIAYEASRGFKAKAPNTQRGYRSHGRIILATFGDAPLTAITRRHVKAFWERLVEERGLAMANGTIAVLRAFLTFCTDQVDGMGANVALNLRLERPKPRVVLWKPGELDAYVALADAAGEHGVGDAVVTALHTAQREGDVLTLPDFIFAADRVALIQAKTKAKVDMPMTAALKVRVAAARRRAAARGRPAATFVVDDRTGGPFNAHTFRHRFAELRAALAGETHVGGRPVTPELAAAVRERNSLQGKPITDAMRAAVAAGLDRYGGKPIAPQILAAAAALGVAPMPAVAGKQFLDLRDTAITRLYMADVPILKMAAISGHSPKSIHTILKHYVALSAGDATAAIAGLERWMQEQGVAI